MAAYPDALPTLREVENDPGVAYDPLQKNVVFAEDTNNIAAEILAIATELGTLPKGSFADVKARLADMTSKTATAQSTANSKGAKTTSLRRYLLRHGYLTTTVESASASQNTWYKMGTTPWNSGTTWSFTNTQSTVDIEVSAWTWGTGNDWLETQFVVDGTGHSYTPRIGFGNAQPKMGTARIGMSLTPGTHTFSANIRRTGSGTALLSYAGYNVDIFEVINT